MKEIWQLIKKHNEIINYLIIGALTTVVSLITYWLFSRGINLNYRISTVLSWIITVIFAFFANKNIVFKSKTATKQEFIFQIINFFKFRLLSLIMDYLLMIIFVEIVNINDLIAKMIVQFIVIVSNYVFSKFLVFNNKIKQ